MPLSSPVTQFAARGVVGSVVLRFLKPFPLPLVVLLSGLLPFAVTPGREDAAVVVRVAGVVGGATMLPRCVGGEPGPRPRKICSEDGGRQGTRWGAGEVVVVLGAVVRDAGNPERSCTQHSESLYQEK